MGGGHRIPNDIDPQPLAGLTLRIVDGPLVVVDVHREPVGDSLERVEWTGSTSTPAIPRLTFRSVLGAEHAARIAVGHLVDPGEIVTVVEDGQLVLLAAQPLVVCMSTTGSRWEPIKITEAATTERPSRGSGGVPAVGTSASPGGAP